MVEERLSDFHVNLKGKRALITGAGAGNGEAIALALAQCGADVALNDLNPDRLERVAGLARAYGGRVYTFDGDVSNRFQAAGFIENSRDALGSRIDILVNAVGVYKAQPLVSIDEWDWRRQIEVLITATFFMTQLVGRVMIDEGAGGAIVNIASTAGHPSPIEQGAGYVTGKAGVIGMTKQTAREYAPHGIRVNAVCPAHITEEDMPTQDDPPNAMRRMGSPAEVADVALFFVSEASRFITGQALNVDGGASML